METNLIGGTIRDLLKEGSRNSQEGAAIYLGAGKQLNHRELEHLLTVAEEDLRSLGIGRNTRVMTALPDGPLTACILLALTRSAICAPVNPDLRRAELESLIPELAAEVLVAHGPCAAEARASAAAAGLPIVEVEFHELTLRWTGDKLENAAIANAPESPDDLALILLTSGSSARPKRVPLTHRHLTLAARRMVESIKLGPYDCCLNMMPMFHVGAVVDLLLAPLSAGGSVMRPETMSVPAFFEALETNLPTWFQGVPTLLHEIAVQALRRSGSHPDNTLRLVRSVSSPLPPEWFSEIEAALGTPVIEIYGMTETAGIITSNPLPPATRKIGSVGQATSLEISIRDADGNAAAAEVRGEIMVRGAGVMTGYEKLDGTDRGLTENGWLKTGDEGYFDAEGYLFITGRIGDQINRGGEKISPREVDEILVSHPAISEAAAFPLPHPHLGHEVAAAIVLQPATSITLEEITAHVSRQLAYFKVPKVVYVLAELPRGPGGKLRRRLLPELVRHIDPLAAASNLDTEAPQTAMEKRVAAWWEKELGVANIGRQGDFFELGGDSLTAASFTVGIEKSLGITIRPAALFDHPTVTAFADYLDQLAGASAVPQAAETPSAEPVLNPDFLRRLLAAMSVWPGQRVDDSSLLVGLRTKASGAPIFWCGQGRGEFDNLASQLPFDHPFYGTRSLYLFEGKTEKDEAALAQLFAREVEFLAAGREIILGGFCAGGRIVMEATRYLVARGVCVKMIFLHETLPLRPVEVPVALGLCADYPSSPFQRFNKPELFLARRFPAGYKSWILTTPHHDVYTPECLAGEIEKLRALWQKPRAFDKGPTLIQLPGVAYRATLSSSADTHRIVAGKRTAIRVKVTNISRHAWPAGNVSGLHLGYRWLGADGKPMGAPGESLPLPREVQPGESILLKLKVESPSMHGQHALEIDMVDEGISWFSEKKSNHPSHSLKLNVQVVRSSLFGIFTKRPHTLTS